MVENKRNQLGGLLLKYYKVLYSANYLESVEDFKKSLREPPIKFLRFTMAFLLAVILLVLTLKKVMVMFSLQTSFLNKIMISVLIGFPLFFLCALLTKYVLASKKLIDKIIDKEEVKVDNIQEAKQIFTRFCQTCNTTAAFIYIFLI